MELVTTRVLEPEKEVFLGTGGDRSRLGEEPNDLGFESLPCNQANSLPINILKKFLVIPKTSKMANCAQNCALN